MSRYATANEIINAVALEVGLLPSSDPVGDSTETFVQLTGLLTSAGQEMVELHPWQVLRRIINCTVVGGETNTLLGNGVNIGVQGVYELPENFSYMFDQTGWDKSNRVAMGGPLDAQDWSYLDGRDLVSQSIYASFRVVEGKMYLFPNPPPEINFRFEYINRNWVLEPEVPSPTDDNYRDSVDSGADIILFERILMIKFLRAKFLESKGFDATAARMEFDTIFNGRTGKDTGAPILNASRNTRGFPYIHPYFNTSDSGYGNP